MDVSSILEQKLKYGQIAPVACIVQRCEIVFLLHIGKLLLLFTDLLSIASLKLCDLLVANRCCFLADLQGGFLFKLSVIVLFSFIFFICTNGHLVRLMLNQEAHHF